MVDFLTTIDQCTLTKLRHIAVRAFPFPCLLNEAHPWSYVTCSFHHVLPLFPGLQLSTLWVGDCFHVRGVGGDIWSYDVAYYIVDDFIESQGFRELIYVVDHDRFLKPVDNPDRGPASDSESEHWQTDTGGRDAQPSTWNTKIQERDGADCGASVTMFRVVDGNRRTAQEFETIQEASDDDQPCHRYDTGQIEIRIKRGKGADYVQKGEQGNKEANPLLKLFKEMTWKEIKEKDPYLDGENNPLSHL